MKIAFRDERLALVRTDRAADTRLPFPVIKACRQKLVALEAAPDEKTLQNWRSLRYRELDGEHDRLRSIQIDDRWEIVFEFEPKQSPPSILIVGIHDNH